MRISSKLAFIYVSRCDPTIKIKHPNFPRFSEEHPWHKSNSDIRVSPAKMKIPPVLQIFTGDHAFSCGEFHKIKKI